MYRFKKLLIILAVLLLPVGSYVAYVLPVFLKYGGSQCFADDDPRKEGYHSDYLWGAIRIKWKYTVVCPGVEPVLDGGNQESHVGFDHFKAPRPIPPRGQWQRSHADVETDFWPVRLHYFAINSKYGLHDRQGWRWDELDGFFLFTIVPIKWIELKPNWELALFNWETRTLVRNRC